MTEFMLKNVGTRGDKGGQGQNKAGNKLGRYPDAINCLTNFTRMHYK